MPEDRDQPERFLAEAGRLLASSLDYEATLAGVAELAVRSLADFCVIDIVEDGEVKRLQVAHADPARAELTRELLRFPPHRPHPAISLMALDSGSSVLMPVVSADLLQAVTQDDDHRRVIEALEVRSLMAVPLLAGEERLGVVVFVSSHGNYDETDLALAERLVRLAALEVNNARLYRDARQALLARDRVLGIVAHDLRNPLNTIAISAELLLTGTGQAQSDRLLQIILRSARGMSRLIQDLLDVARIEAGQFSLHREVHDPCDLLQEAVELDTSRAKARSLDLAYEVCPGTSAVSADRDRILQVLSNLIGNAIKFTPEGGRIRARVEQVEEGVRFSVTDTGLGIAAEDLPRLFQPFWQAQRGSLDGAGLGLMIARGIVEAHGGTIHAESPPGQGSIFYFTLPPASPPPRRERRTGRRDRRAASSRAAPACA